MRKAIVWLTVMLCTVLFLGSAQDASAQFFGGYGAGFTPSPQASYGPNGAVTGALYPNGMYVGTGGYIPPGPASAYGYPAMGYGYGRPMPLGQALVTAAIITNMNRGYGYGAYSRGYNRGYYRGRH